VQANLHAGMSFAKGSEGGEQGVDGAFVDTEGEFTSLEAFKLDQALFYLFAEVEKALGILAE
jgi:hypothetical protein